MNKQSTEQAGQVRDGPRRALTHYLNTAQEIRSDEHFISEIRHLLFLKECWRINKRCAESFSVKFTVKCPSLLITAFSLWLLRLWREKRKVPLFSKGSSRFTFLFVKIRYSASLLRKLLWSSEGSKKMC